MAKVITFSRVFPSYHPRAGEPTYFVEKIWTSLDIVTEGLHFSSLPEHEVLSAARGHYYENDELNPKHHTIRAGHRWKEGDWFSPRVWSGKPYNSKQIQFAPDIQIKKIYSFSIGLAACYIDQQRWVDKDFIAKVAGNDGLEYNDFLKWFQYPKPFNGQIIIWNESINY
jgi:hypothetical protein